MQLNNIFRRILPAICGVLLLSLCSVSAQKKYLSNDDAMKLRRMAGRVFSENGNYFAYYTMPDRGNLEGCLYSVLKDTTYRIPNGKSPSFNQSADWAFFEIAPTGVESEKTGDKKPKNGLAIVKTETGEATFLKNVGKYIPTNDGQWLAYSSIASKPEKPDEKKKSRPVGNTIFLRNLASEGEIEISNVSQFEFDSTSTYFVFVREDKTAENNGLFYINLKGGFAAPMKVEADTNCHIANLCWNNKKNLLAYTAGRERFDGAPDTLALKLWYPETKRTEIIVDSTKMRPNLRIPQANELRWTKDGERLFFGTKLKSDTSEFFPDITYNDSNYYNIDTILTQTTLDMWHVKDPRIKTYQHVWWDKNKDNTFTAVFDLLNMQYVQLADTNLPDVMFAENADYTIGSTDLPYLYKSTWDIGCADIYKVNIHSGEKTLVAENVYSNPTLSPLGNYTAYYKERQWYLHNNKLGETICLTDKANVTFYDDKDDHPGIPSEFGAGGWLDNDEGLMLYDRYDIWLFNTSNPQAPLNLTDAAGRRTNNTYRVIRTNSEKPSFARNEVIYLTQFDNKAKTRGIAEMDLSILGATSIIMEENDIRFVGKAKNAEKYLFSKESYDIFPDVWLTDADFVAPKQITNVNPTMHDYLWGTMHLMDYVSAVGDTLGGYYIMPENPVPGKRYPVVIFFYEMESDDAHSFMIPWNNHLPTGPMYAGDDYILFFPDVRFQVGNPGQSSLDCLIPACRKLGQLGVADTNNIGLWGHSWSGYQAAFNITRTDYFKCVIAGAPVGNMTSAYSGIRLASGLTRQFQYELQQSRIGGSLWDSLDSYIRNSPIFFANKVNTPILIEFGNQDDAVPWTQGMELFLALRRAQKDAIMLEYRNEPHHPRKYHNRLDYNIRMKEYYDYHLKGKPAADWILHGIEYRGK